MRSALFVAVLVLLAGLAFAAGEGESAGDGEGGTEPTVLSIYAQYSSDDEMQPYDYAVEQMQQLMPEVELELDIMAQDDNRKIKVYAAAGNLPDIFASNPDVISTFRTSDNLLLLDSYVEQTGMADLLSQSGRDLLFDADGHVYAMPNVGPWAATLYYNKAVFEQFGVDLPVNFDEFIEAVRVFRANDIIPIALYGQKWVSLQLYDMLASRYNTVGMAGLDNGTASISDDAFALAAERLIELVEAGAMPADVFNMLSDESYALFQENRAAMYLSGGWTCSGLGELMGDGVGLLWAPLAPAGSEAETQWVMSGGGFNQGFSVAANTEYPDLAGLFAVNFGYQFQRGRIVRRGDPNPIIVNPPAPEQGYNQIQQEYALASQSFQSMTTFPWGLTNATLKTALEDNVQQLLTGTYGADEFIENVSQALR